MHLVQLQSFTHGENDAADSTAFFHSGGAAWGRSAQAPHRERKRNYTVESASKFFMNTFAAVSFAEFALFFTMNYIFHF